MAFNSTLGNHQGYFIAQRKFPGPSYPYNVIMEVAKHLGPYDLPNLLLAYPHFTYLIPLLEIAAQHHIGEDLRDGSFRFIKSEKMALCWAIWGGSRRLMEVLLKGGMDPNVRDGSGYSPLHLSILKQDKDMVLLLLQNGAAASINNVHNFVDGPAALHTASWQPGMAGTVSLLLQYGADINQRIPGSGVTALYGAVNSNNIDAARTLCSLGADTFIGCKNGYKPLHLAIIIGYENRFKDCPYDSIPMVRLLLEKGAYVNDTTFNGDTPLHLAAEARLTSSVELVKLLLKHGACIDLKNKRGMRPIEVAWSKCGSVEALGIVNLLVAEMKQGPCSISRLLN